MADSQERYTRTDVPVCSLEYKKILSDVKKNKIEIEDRDPEIRNLKKTFDELCVSRQSIASSSKNDIDSDSYEEPLVDRHGSTVRQAIVTPGGTKRKGEIELYE